MCPDPDELARFADGQATAEESEALSKHIDTCASCREVLVAMARTDPGQTPKPPEDDLPEKGAIIGRYVVLESRGAGGMGLVVSAYDSQLDRKVALKLVRPDFEAQGGAEKSRARLVREAQLMARVRHPNVLTVYEVGERGAQVFIAMELVEGHTLRSWLKAAPRRRAEIIDLFLQAGRALAAAHAAGVVHRDFKPENVLVDASNRAQVTDFGLAWSGAPPSGTPLDRSSPVNDPRYTGVVGTPAYMAPEQLKGDGADGRSDQFSFCVAMWEALTGQRPYRADDLRALEKAIASRSISAPAVRLPAALEAALRRGLDPDPSARFPSMEPLLDALTPRSRRVWWAAAAAALVATAATALISRPGVGCELGAAPFAGVWDAARRAQISTGFGADKAEIFEAVANALDRRTADWLAAWKTSCEATRVKHTQTEETLSRHRVCLDNRLDELRALSDLLANPGPGAVENATFAVARLKPARACLSGEAFGTLPLPQDLRQRQTIAQARLELARSDARSAAGQPKAALESADAALALARLAHYPPIEAEAHLARVDPMRELGRYDDAEKELEVAALAAEAGRHFDALLHIAVKHIRVIDSARTEEAEAWIHRAENNLEHSPRADLQAELDSVVSILRLAQRRPKDSRARALAALEYYDRSGELAMALASRHIAALALRAQGKAQPALAELEPALLQYEKVLGPAHPLTLHVRIHRCELLLDLGRAEDALAALEGPELSEPGRLTPSWELARQGLKGEALRMRGKLVSARAVMVEAIDRALSLPDRLRAVATTRVRLAATLREVEDFAGAERELRAAITELEAVKQPSWLWVHGARIALAEAELASGKSGDALERAQTAAKALGELLDAAAPEQVAAQLLLIQALLDSNQPAAAGRAADALLQVGVEGLVHARALLLKGLAMHAEKNPEADEVLIRAVQALDAMALYPAERLRGLAALKSPQPQLADCAQGPSWAGIELGPRAMAMRASVEKRHCARR